MQPLSFQNAVEKLDARRLLSAAMSGGQLVINGTPGPDHVLIHVDPVVSSHLLVNLNGQESGFSLADITGGIVINLGSGADHAIVDESEATIHLPITMFGGGGSDLLIGGSGNDQLYGGPGRDRLIGGAGDDLISGGSSRDKIAGGDGDDTLLGGLGDDAIDGGAGSDLISGGFGDDYITGGDGSDVLIGGQDFDTLQGDNGNDVISGGSGDDDIDGGAGTNDISGGAGADSFAQAPAGNGNSDVIFDKTAGSDTQYTPVSLDVVPTRYQNLFNDTFPDSTPVSVRVNDDHTFDLLYRYNGDGTVYHAYFSFTGSHPFDNLNGVKLQTYEVAPANLPPLTAAAFEAAHPNAVIKDVVAEHVGEQKFALIRILEDGQGQSKWVVADWLDNQ